MAKRQAKAKRPAEERVQLSDSLVRVTLAAGGAWFEHEYRFFGRFEVICPRCEKPAAIVGVALTLELSCGCRWHAPSAHRRHDPEAWLKFEGTQADCGGTDRENSREETGELLARVRDAMRQEAVQQEAVQQEAVQQGANREAMQELAVWAG